KRDAAVDTALAVMSVKRCIVVKLIKQRAKVYEIISYIIGMHSRILPAGPGIGHGGYKGRGTQAGFPDFPDHLLLFFIVNQTDIRRIMTIFNLSLQLLDLLICLA